MGHETIHGTWHTELTENIQLIDRILGHSADMVRRDFVFGQSVQGSCFYIDGLVSTAEIDEVLRSFLHRETEQIRTIEQAADIIDRLHLHIIANASVHKVREVSDGIKSVLEGDSLFIINGCQIALLVSARQWNGRSVEEPQTEQVVRGPRDGFTENIRTNTALVRRRIRDPFLRIEGLQIGKRSRTDINVAYIEGIVKDGLVDEVMERLRRIEIDAVLESGYIEELMEDAPFSPFTTVQSTERPDKVAASILEGRVAVFVDNTPFVLLVPTYFWQFLQASDDYYSRYLTASFFRIIRYIAFVISLTLPSLYVMLASFHQEMIPTPLALTIASGRDVVPFPILLEALLMEVTFELMREAGLRMPKPVGQAVSIVGSLVIGQAAVQAGVVSTFMVIIIALTGISSFAIPNYSASYSIRLIRFPLLIASGTLGLLGFAAMFTFLVVHALSLRSFGESYLAPASPFQPYDQKDAVIRMPWWSMTKRPQLSQADGDRVGKRQRPSARQEDEQRSSQPPAEPKEQAPRQKKESDESTAASRNGGTV